MVEEEYLVDDVFGINRDLPLNYVAREAADTVLIDNLARRQHLVIYGSSKQGKTSLRKHCLNEEDYIVVHCSNKWGLDDVHEAILKQAGYELTVSTTMATSGKQKIFAKIKAGIFGAETEGGAEAERTHEEGVTKTPLELDPLNSKTPSRRFVRARISYAIHSRFSHSGSGWARSDLGVQYVIWKTVRILRLPFVTGTGSGDS